MASKRVIEKCGFKLIGKRPKVIINADGTISDDMIYYLTDINNLPQLKVIWGEN